MKITLMILQKAATVNPQDKVILGALHQLGFTDIASVHLGRYLELTVDGSLSEDEWKRKLTETFQKATCSEFPNPVMEDYHIEVVR